MKHDCHCCQRPEYIQMLMSVLDQCFTVMSVTENGTVILTTMLAQLTDSTRIKLHTHYLTNVVSLSLFKNNMMIYHRLISSHFLRPPWDTRIEKSFVIKKC